MAAAAHALVEMLGIGSAPLLALAELSSGVIRVPWLGRLRTSESPAFSVGLEGIEEEAVRIFLNEENEPVPGESGSFRIPHIDEGGFRPGLHAKLRPTGSVVAYAVSAATAFALALQADGTITDSAEAWVAAVGGSPTHRPRDFAEMLRSERRYASVTDGASALWARRPAKRAAARSDSP